MEHALEVGPVGGVSVALDVAGVDEILLLLSKNCLRKHLFGESAEDLSPSECNGKERENGALSGMKSNSIPVSPPSPLGMNAKVPPRCFRWYGTS